jgi:hypothetical protein
LISSASVVACVWFACSCWNGSAAEVVEPAVKRSTCRIADAAYSFFERCVMKIARASESTRLRPISHFPRQTIVAMRCSCIPPCHR